MKVFDRYCCKSQGVNHILNLQPSPALTLLLFSPPLLTTNNSYGPEGAGKTLMTEIVASEVNAMVIKLSSTSIGNAFEGGDDATKLIHMIFTVAKDQSLSPVIIYLDQCHEFFKSKKKGSSGSPDTAINESTMKRFQESLLVYKNQFLTKQDRVLVIGCTNTPDAADMKLIRWKGPSGKPEKQFFEHSLYFPKFHNNNFKP
jgi:SpoVK/Ycf46/Vps4 family AAA+-type ATPase